MGHHRVRVNRSAAKRTDEVPFGSTESIFSQVGGPSQPIAIFSARISINRLAVYTPASPATFDRLNKST